MNAVLPTPSVLYHVQEKKRKVETRNEAQCRWRQRGVHAVFGSFVRGKVHSNVKGY